MANVMVEGRLTFVTVYFCKYVRNISDSKA